jgi:hypothetical protein
MIHNTRLVVAAVVLCTFTGTIAKHAVADIVFLTPTRYDTAAMNPDGSVGGFFPPGVPPFDNRMFAERNFDVGPPNFDPLEIRRFAASFDRSVIPFDATINSVDILFTRASETGTGTLLSFHGFVNSHPGNISTNDFLTNNQIATIFVSGTGTQNVGVSNANLASFFQDSNAQFIGISGRKGVGDLGAGSAAIDNFRLQVNFTPTAVPEPSSVLLMGLASSGLLIRRWRNRK